MSIVVAMVALVGVVLLPGCVFTAEGREKRNFTLLWLLLLVVLIVSMWIASVQYPCPKYC